MKLFFTSILLFFIFENQALYSQEVFSVFNSEMMFQSGTFKANGEQLNSKLRFSFWLNIGEYIHVNFGNNFGLYSGLALGNIGFIADNNDIKIKYRAYELGLPLALKLGSFRKNIFIYSGGEYDWMFQFKQKVFEGGSKTKHSEWFSNRVNPMIPAIFAGIQLPKGLNLKIKFYLDDFLNNKYEGTGTYDNYTGFTESRIWCISLSYQIKNSKLKEISQPTNMAYNSVQ